VKTLFGCKTSKKYYLWLHRPLGNYRLKIDFALALVGAAPAAQPKVGLRTPRKFFLDIDFIDFSA